jgi:N6-adenosine-specific RNA methylase IME4
MNTTEPQTNGKITGKFKTILVAPRRRMSRRKLAAIPVAEFADHDCLLYFWMPTPKLFVGLSLMQRWGFTYREQLTVVRWDVPVGGWITKGVIAIVPFGTTGNAITRPEATRQDNLIRVPRESDPLNFVRGILTRCNYPPFLQIFGGGDDAGWTFTNPA